MTLSRDDYVRTDQIREATVPIGWLPDLYGVSRVTINAWIKRDNITTFPYPIQSGEGRPTMAVRFGDILDAANNSTRWQKRNTNL